MPYKREAFALFGDDGPEIRIARNFIVEPSAIFRVFGDSGRNQAENAKLVFLTAEFLQEFRTAH